MSKGCLSCPDGKRNPHWNFSLISKTPRVVCQMWWMRSCSTAFTLGNGYFSYLLTNWLFTIRSGRIETWHWRSSFVKFRSHHKNFWRSFHESHSIILRSFCSGSFEAQHWRKLVKKHCSHYLILVVTPRKESTTKQRTWSINWPFQSTAKCLKIVLKKL